MTYELKSIQDDGRAYVVVTLDDGSTFGQNLVVKDEIELETLVQEAVERVAGPTKEVSQVLRASVGVRKPLDMIVAVGAARVK